jgi:NACHT conflict system protein/AAA domain-containing protein
LTFRGALRILGRTDTPLINTLDTLLGGVILTAGVGAAVAAGGGPFGAAVLAPAWQWVDQKNEAGGLLRKLTARFAAKIEGAAGLERRQLIAAAHSTIVVAAYFDVFHEAVGEAGFGGFELTAKEQQKAALGPACGDAASLVERLYASEIPAPSATRGFTENTQQVGEWLGGLHEATADLLHSLKLLRLFQRQMPTLPERAVKRYESHYIDLAAAVPEFEIWTDLAEHAATRARMDTSFEEIKALLSGLGARAGRTPPVAQALDRANTGRLADLVVSTNVPWPDAGVRFPSVAELFVPPAFRIAVFDSASRASDDRWWAALPRQRRLVDRLAAHILSTDAPRGPLLLLGHPGAGKSMLTTMLAAGLPAAEYTTVSVPLRAVSPHASIMDQIQEGLDLATNGRVTWADLADQTADRLRVVLLDGLDELLQAADLDRTGYLHEVVRFQQVEADQDRPVAVVVTSRTVVADRVDIPPGTAMLKIAAFDDDQIGEWIERWNKATPGLGTRRLTRAEALRQPLLARQPLLLMLLALYAGGPGSAELDADSSKATLYGQLFTRFAGRETAKGTGRALPRDEVRDAIETSIDRLSIAALAMFNRGRQHVGETELGHDLETLYGEAGRGPQEAGKRLLAEFFFIHTSEATLIAGRPAERSYEFLHATFGEYLVAWKVVEVLREIADVAYGRRRRRDPDDDQLSVLIAHQALATQPPILQFAGQILQTLPEDESANVTEALDFLIGRWRTRRSPEKYRGYRPVPSDDLRQLATYAANLVVLRLAAEPDGLTRSPQLERDWPALVALWSAGLNPDAWLATLSAMTLDPWDGTLRAEPPGHGRTFPDYDAARLSGRTSTAAQLALGAAVLNKEHGVTDEQEDWLLFMKCWLIPAIAFGLGPHGGVNAFPPPSEVSGTARTEIGHLLGHLLRFRPAELGADGARQVAGLLLDLDPRPDSTALALAICEYPRLLVELPALAEPSLYQRATPTALMMYGAQARVGAEELPQWLKLYRALCEGAGFRPDQEGYSSHGAEMLLRHLIRARTVPRPSKSP